MPEWRKLFMVVLGVAALAASAAPAVAGTKSVQFTALRSSITLVRQATWAWQDAASVRRTPTAYTENRFHSAAYLRWTRQLWHQRMLAAKQHAQNPPHMRDWLCIHQHEGSWTDPGSPYFGGLQMDWSFMQAYGPKLLRTKGTADHWTPLEQIWVAERAYESGRGFYPWPNTARMCGLI